jgi:hypothetical protein
MGFGGDLPPVVDDAEGCPADSSPHRAEDSATFPAAIAQPLHAVRTAAIDAGIHVDAEDMVNRRPTNAQTGAFRPQTAAYRRTIVEMPSNQAP